MSTESIDVEAAMLEYSRTDDSDGELTLEDEYLIRTLDFLAATTQRDYLEGGIPTDRIAAGLDCDASTVRDRLGRLIAEGHIARVYGARPGDYRARESYLPADHPDAGRPPRRGEIR